MPLPRDRSSAVTILGVLNVTPDSFSDGGRYRDLDAAIAHGVRLAEDGADIVDVGGESTRPGAERVPSLQEQARVVPVIRELAARGIRISIDTMNAETARAAVEAGAGIVNDVSGGLADPAMGAFVAESELPYIVMHWRGHSTGMDFLTHYADVVSVVREELAARVDALLAAGVRSEQLILDPGLGFAKTREQDWELLTRLEEFAGSGLPVLVGASRKRFLAELLPPGENPQATERLAALDAATAVTSAFAARAGAWGVRVHNVVATRRALELVGAGQVTASDSADSASSGRI